MVLGRERSTRCRCSGRGSSDRPHAVPGMRWPSVGRGSVRPPMTIVSGVSEGRRPLRSAAARRHPSRERETRADGEGPRPSSRPRARTSLDACVLPRSRRHEGFGRRSPSPLAVRERSQVVDHARARIGEEVVEVDAVRAIRLLREKLALDRARELARRWSSCPAGRCDRSRRPARTAGACSHRARPCSPRSGRRCGRSRHRGARQRRGRRPPTTRAVSAREPSRAAGSPPARAAPDCPAARARGERRPTLRARSLAASVTGAPARPATTSRRTRSRIPSRTTARASRSRIPGTGARRRR